MNFTLTEKTVKGQKTTNNYGSFSLLIPYPLDPVQDTAYQGMNVDPHAYGLPTPIIIPEQDVLRLYGTEDFLEIQGTTKYFDGFSAQQPTPSASRYVTFGTPGRGAYSDEFFPCAEYSVLLSRIREYREQDEEYHKKHTPSGMWVKRFIALTCRPGPAECRCRR